jgi:hypothetical protein
MILVEASKAPKGPKVPKAETSKGGHVVMGNDLALLRSFASFGTFASSPFVLPHPYRLHVHKLPYSELR